MLVDGHGSTRQLVSGSSTVIINQQYNYDAYGVGLSLPASAGTSLLYAGEQFDSVLKQYYLRARYYDPSNGRFNQLDSFAGNNFDPQSLHKYDYCRGDSINGVDPSGQFTVTELLVAIAIIGVLVALLYPAVKAAKSRAHYADLVNNEVRQLVASAHSFDEKQDTTGQLATITDTNQFVFMGDDGTATGSSTPIDGALTDQNGFERTPFIHLLPSERQWNYPAWSLFRRKKNGETVLIHNERKDGGRPSFPDDVAVFVQKSFWTGGRSPKKPDHWYAVHVGSNVNLPDGSGVPVLRDDYYRLPLDIQQVWGRRLDGTGWGRFEHIELGKDPIKKLDSSDY